MLIQCLGHSKFLLTLQSGYRIVTDPFDASTGYPVGDTEADAVLVSHHHSDHDAVDTVKGYTVVIDSEGVHTLNPQIRVRSLACFHDDQKGALRGNNLIHCIEAEGMSVVHLGDLGHMPDNALAERIGHPDDTGGRLLYHRCENGNGSLRYALPESDPAYALQDSFQQRMADRREG